jgi:hypothetical protein
VWTKSMALNANAPDASQVLCLDCLILMLRTCTKKHDSARARLSSNTVIN